jgi:hypothetical protein
MRMLRNSSRTNPAGFQELLKNSFPRNGDHPAETLQVIFVGFFEWDVGASKTRNSYSFFVRS